jgi:hypothetical protein
LILKLLAEREGFEPPIELPLCLISSQVHSTGLCHLSALLRKPYEKRFKALAFHLEDFRFPREGFVGGES